jgi:hypothetical protein
MPSRDFQWFWDKVDQSGGDDACWPWLGGLRTPSQQYGRAFIGRKAIAAHRLALILRAGEPESVDLVACHRCDNPWCCNPDHLWWSTQAENVRDCVEKGRKANMGARRFDRAELLRLRAEGWSYSNPMTPDRMQQGKGGVIEPGTPLPWKVYRATNGSLLGIGDSDAGGVTDYAGGLWRSGQEKELNAEYIVTACNSFPELLSALETVRTDLHAIASLTTHSRLDDGENIDWMERRATTALLAVNAAIARAKGEAA